MIINSEGIAVGKKAQIKRQKIEEERKRQKELRQTVYHAKNPWLKFWTRVEFWILLVCLGLLVAYPFVHKPKTAVAGGGAVVQTSMGEIDINFYSEDAPKTVENFKKLAGEGFYDGLTWHRVIKGFMIQTGDPNGDGTGGPGYKFDDEINSHQIVVGTVAMANSGENTNGSQFFIVSDEAQPNLDGKYTVFGYVTKGMDVVKTISEAPTDENDKPLVDITMERVTIK